MVEGSGNSRFVIWKYYCIERSEFVLGMGGRTTFERIFNFRCVTFERILPVVYLGNLIYKNVKNRIKNIYTLL